jgi:hypothetical protein
VNEAARGAIGRDAALRLSGVVGMNSGVLLMQLGKPACCHVLNSLASAEDVRRRIARDCAASTARSVQRRPVTGRRSIRSNVARPPTAAG